MNHDHIDLTLEFSIPMNLCINVHALMLCAVSFVNALMSCAARF